MKCAGKVYSDRLTVRRLIQLFRKELLNMYNVINILYVCLKLGKLSTFWLYTIPESHLRYLTYAFMQEKIILFFSVQ